MSTEREPASVDNCLWSDKVSDELYMKSQLNLEDKMNTSETLATLIQPPRCRCTT